MRLRIKKDKRYSEFNEITINPDGTYNVSGGSFAGYHRMNPFYYMRKAAKALLCISLIGGMLFFAKPNYKDSSEHIPKGPALKTEHSINLEETIDAKAVAAPEDGSEVILRRIEWGESYSRIAKEYGACEAPGDCRWEEIFILAEELGIAGSNPDYIRAYDYLAFAVKGDRIAPASAGEVSRSISAGDYSIAIKDSVVKAGDWVKLLAEKDRNFSSALDKIVQYNAPRLEIRTKTAGKSGVTDCATNQGNRKEAKGIMRGTISYDGRENYHRPGRGASAEYDGIQENNGGGKTMEDYSLQDIIWPEDKEFTPCHGESCSCTDCFAEDYETADDCPDFEEIIEIGRKRYSCGVMSESVKRQLLGLESRQLSVSVDGKVCSGVDWSNPGNPLAGYTRF